MGGGHWLLESKTSHSCTWLVPSSFFLTFIFYMFSYPCNPYPCLFLYNNFALLFSSCYQLLSMLFHCYLSQLMTSRQNNKLLQLSMTIPFYCYLSLILHSLSLNQKQDYRFYKISKYVLLTIWISRDWDLIYHILHLSSSSLASQVRQSSSSSGVSPWSVGCGNLSMGVAGLFNS